MVVNLRRGAPVSAGTTLPSAGGLLRDPSCSQLDPSRTLPMESCCPGVKSCVQSVGAAPKKKKKKKKKKKNCSESMSYTDLTTAIPSETNKVCLMEPWRVIQSHCNLKALQWNYI